MMCRRGTSTGCSPEAMGTIRRRNSRPFHEREALARHIRHCRRSRFSLRPSRSLHARLTCPNQLRLLRYPTGLFRHIYNLPWGALPQNQAIPSMEGHNNNLSHFEQVYDDSKTELPPLPPDITSSAGYYGNEFGYSEMGAATSTSSEAASYSYLGFESGDYVHSPMFSTMPPVSEKMPEGFDLGGSSYFF